MINGKAVYHPHGYGVDSNMHSPSNLRNSAARPHTIGDAASASVEIIRSVESGETGARCARATSPFGERSPKGGQCEEWRYSSSKRTYPTLAPQRIDFPIAMGLPDRIDDSVSINCEEKSVNMKRLRDIQLRVVACKRGGRRREEGRCCLALGIICDNLKEYEAAIGYYEDFLQICIDFNDTQGTALGYHCLGVDYHLMGRHLRDHGRTGPGGLKNAAKIGGKSKKFEFGNWKEFLLKSIEFHEKHQSIADSIGCFISYLNRGIAYADLGMAKESTISHEIAVRFANLIHSEEGMKMAIGCLSNINSVPSDRMRDLTEQYLLLSRNLGNLDEAAGAMAHLGKIAASTGNYEEGVDMFRKALVVSRQQKNRRAENFNRVNFGIISGQSKFPKLIEDILKKRPQTTSS